jgi:hypothetical protein
MAPVLRTRATGRRNWRNGVTTALDCQAGACAHHPARDQERHRTAGDSTVTNILRDPATRTGEAPDARPLTELERLRIRRQLASRFGDLPALSAHVALLDTRGAWYAARAMHAWLADAGDGFLGVVRHVVRTQLRSAVPVFGVRRRFLPTLGQVGVATLRRGNRRSIHGRKHPESGAPRASPHRPRKVGSNGTT